MSPASILPTDIADLAGVDMPLDLCNGTEAGVWMCGGSASDTAATVSQAASDNVYVRRRVFINVYLVVGLCAFGFVGNGLTVAVLRRDKVQLL